MRRHAHVSPARSNRNPQTGRTNFALKPCLESLESRTVLSAAPGVSAGGVAEGHAAHAEVSSLDADLRASAVADEAMSDSPSLATGDPSQAELDTALAAIRLLVDAAGAGDLLFIRADGAVGAPCASDASTESDTPQATDAEKLEALRQKLEDLQRQLEKLEKEERALIKEGDDVENKLAEKNPPPREAEKRRLEKRSQEIRDRLDAIKKEKAAKQAEIDKVNDEIKELEKKTAQDQDGDGVPDDSASQDAAGIGLLIPGSLLDLCHPPSDWDALVAVHWGDGGTRHIDVFLAPADWDAIAATLASQPAAGDSHDLSSLDNDTGAIDFVRWARSNLDNDTGAIDFERWELSHLDHDTGAIDVFFLNLTNLDNDTGAIDFVRLGADVPSSSDAGDVELVA